MISTLKTALKKADICLSSLQERQFTAYYNLLTEWNGKMNLTAITKPEEVAIKHFYDSITLLMYADIPENSSLIDIGTGAGFPSIPVKILRPDIKITLLDSLKKRLTFLREVCSAIGVEADIIHKRAEDGGRDKTLREQFDIAVSRAVANMNTLCEYCMPYVKTGGLFAAMKGKNGREELCRAEKAVDLLSGKTKDVFSFSLPTGDERTIILINKIKPCAARYPRQWGKIKASPLGCE